MLYQGYSSHDQMAAVLCQFLLDSKAIKCPHGQGDILATVTNKKNMEEPWVSISI